jgi:hypothetical protein
MTKAQNEAFAEFENLSGIPPDMGLDVLEEGKVTAWEVWKLNQHFFDNIANEIQHIRFPMTRKDEAAQERLKYGYEFWYSGKPHEG